MKIIAINKTLNESRHISRYCRWNNFCDLILVADGGSQDDTVARARQYPNVRVREFKERIEFADGSFMNPEPAHFNFLIEWAEEEGADWIILTGCDEWPNLPLYREAYDIIKAAHHRGFLGIAVPRLYMWNDNKYFPRINQINPALWAWSTRFKVRCDENGNSFFDSVMPGPSQEEIINRYQPYALMHYYAGDEITPDKLARYAAWGHPQIHPLESIYAPPEPLPDWARENQT